MTLMALGLLVAAAATLALLGAAMTIIAIGSTVRPRYTRTGHSIDSDSSAPRLRISASPDPSPSGTAPGSAVAVPTPVAGLGPQALRDAVGAVTARGAEVLTRE